MTLFGKIIFGGLGVIILMGIFYGTRMYVNQDQGQVVIQENSAETIPFVTEEATTSMDTNLQNVSTTTSKATTTQEKSKATSTKSTTQKAATTLQVETSIRVSTSSEATSTNR